jgi:hypothetical protein
MNMKKAIYLLIIFLCSSSIASQAQLRLITEDGTDVSYDTIYQTIYPTNSLFELHIKLINEYGGNFNTKARRTNVQMIDGTQNYFCWGTCYSPPVNVSSGNDFVLVPANDTCNTALLCYFKPLGNTGDQIIRYSIFDTGANIDSVSFVLVIHVEFPSDPLLLQIPEDDFVTNTDVYLNTDIDTTVNEFHEIIYPLNITNNSNTIKQILVKKKELNIISGSQNFFAWKSTYSPSVFNDTSGILIYPNTTINNRFKAIYRPNGTIGESIIQYVFYNKFDLADSSYVNIHFNAIQNGIAHYSNDDLNIYPNPAKEILQVNGLNTSSSVSIIDIHGSRILNESIDGKTNKSINVSNLSSGIYFLEIRSSKGVSFKKFVKE